MENTVNTQGILFKMREWVEAEIKKAQAPYQEPFLLTSLTYCAEKTAGASRETDAALDLLRSTAEIESQVGTYDVVTPYVAIFLINRALARC
jgi:hypothetical protein